MFVVDSADVGHRGARGTGGAAPHARRGNKQDLPGALSAPALTEQLGLRLLRSHNWYIHLCCVVMEKGLYGGLDWLVGNISAGTAPA